MFDGAVEMWVGWFPTLTDCACETILTSSRISYGEFEELGSWIELI